MITESGSWNSKTENMKQTAIWYGAEEATFLFSYCNAYICWLSVETKITTIHILWDESMVKLQNWGLHNLTRYTVHVQYIPLYGTSAYIINIQVGYCWIFVSVVNCVPFLQVWCIRSSSPWSPWDLWESEVTADSRDPIVMLSEPCYERYLHLVSSVFRISADSIFGGSFFLEPSWISTFSYSRQQFCCYIYSGFFLSGSLLVFWCIDFESSSFAAVFRRVLFKQPATRAFSLDSLFTCVYIALHCLHCFVVTSFALHFTDVFPIYLWTFDFVNIMPSQSSKSPLAPSAKTHSFLRKSTDESPLIKTTSTFLPGEVRTSQSTKSLSPRSN